MRNLESRLSPAFTGGVVGAVVNSFAVQLAALARPDAAPASTPEWLYPRLVWGGVWGLLLAAPVLPGRPVARGLVASLAPSLARLTVFAPPDQTFDAPTILSVLVFNAIWGLVAALWLDRAEGGEVMS